MRCTCTQNTHTCIHTNKTHSNGRRVAACALHVLSPSSCRRANGSVCWIRKAREWFPLLQSVATRCQWDFGQGLFVWHACGFCARACVLNAPDSFALHRRAVLRLHFELYWLCTHYTQWIFGKINLKRKPQFVDRQHLCEIKWMHCSQHWRR